MNQSIEQTLQAMIPISALVNAMFNAQLAFVIVAVLFILTGYVMGLIRSETILSPLGKMVVLMVAVAASPWILNLSQSIANALTAAVASSAGVNWVPAVPSGISLALDYSSLYATMSQYFGQQFSPPPIDLNPWTYFVYSARVIFIAATGLAAAITVFIMQIMLIVQKIIMIFSSLLIPVFISFMAVPATEGTGQMGLKSIAAVMCWPIGWAIVNIGTVAGFQHVALPSQNAGVGELLWAGITLCLVCAWPILGTLLAPVLIGRMITRGTNFISGMMGAFIGVAGSAAVTGIQGASTAAGALAGGLASGPAGAALGTAIGNKAGGMAATPVALLTHAMESVNEERQALPSVRSASVADAAIKYASQKS
jgi:hypothetical protein